MPSFVFFGDDDTLVHVPNLLALLHRDATDSPLFLGNAWCRAPHATLHSGARHICGGGGFVLSAAALELIAPPGGSAVRPMQAELVRLCQRRDVLHDVALSLLLEAKGIQPTHANAFHYVYRPPPHCARRAASSGCAPRVSTDPGRQTDPARPVSFHLRGRSSRDVRTLHELLCADAGRRAYWDTGGDGAAAHLAEERRFCSESHAMYSVHPVAPLVDVYVEKTVLT
jgi:hypothetical protein